LNPEKIIISPGPATPNEAGISLEVVKAFHKDTPIFGICLGHQTIAQAFGGKIVRAKNLIHGKTSQIEVYIESPIFNSMPSEFTATRYHSLVVEKDSLPKNLIATAFSSDDHEIMALQVKNLPVYGVQFHPESIMSEHGHLMLDNFLKL